MRKGRRKTSVITNVERYVIAPIYFLPFAIGEAEGWGGVLLARTAPPPDLPLRYAQREEKNICHPERLRRRRRDLLLLVVA